MMYTPFVRFTPVGEYLRLIILRRLKEGPTSVEELDEIVRRAVERLGVSYNWRIWPRLLLGGEVEFRGDIAVITPRGRQILEPTSEEVAEYVRRWLGVEP
jgi:DNA-binding transcriptional ArsR family regulator